MNELFEKYIEEAIAVLVLIVVGSLTAFLKKLKAPKLKKKKTPSLEEAQAINRIMEELINRTGAMSGHILRFYKEKNKKGKNYWRGTIFWEEIGHPCNDCVAFCPVYKKSVRLEEWWTDQRLSKGYHEKVFSKLPESMRKVHTITIDDMPPEDQVIWAQIGMVTLKIAGIRRDKSNVYAMDLLFCNKYKKEARADGVMAHASSKLINHV